MALSSLARAMEDNAMHDELPMQKLDAYRIARELARRVHLAGIRDAELRDQATRASKSTFLQLCEGLPLDSVAMRRKYFACANGSLHETVGASTSRPPSVRSTTATHATSSRSAPS